jgi:hypothetical protein
MPRHKVPCQNMARASVVPPSPRLGRASPKRIGRAGAPADSERSCASDRPNASSSSRSARQIDSGEAGSAFGEESSKGLCVSVLGASGLIYAEANPLAGLSSCDPRVHRMREHVWGSPAVWVPDHLKRGVTLARRCEPEITALPPSWRSTMARWSSPRVHIATDATVAVGQRATSWSNPMRRSKARTSAGVMCSSRRSMKAEKEACRRSRSSSAACGSIIQA